MLLVGTSDYTSVGRPRVENAKILATVEEQSQTEKTLIFKKRRRKDSQRHRGHRQWVTVLKIDKIMHDIDENNINQGNVNILNANPIVNIV